MKTNGIDVLEKTLRKNKGADVLICISHNLYGDQKIKTQLYGIFNKKQVGFCVGSQKIFINRGEIVDYGVDDGIYFADDLMKIKIKLNSAV